MIYSDKLKEYRKESNITQRQIANILNISSSCYARYENETDIFPIKHLLKTCDYLDISLDYIFDFNNRIKYDNYKQSINLQKTGMRIKELRKENKLTQEKLASILNIGNGTLADYERGRYIIATPFLYTLCKKYSISADYLLGKVDSPKYFK